MKAIICLAGEGKRLRPLTEECPKGLIAIGGKTILEHLLDRLSSVGLNEVIVVLGYKAESVKAKVGKMYKSCKITYIMNPDYATTDNLYSLWLARDHVSSGMIFFNGDILFHEDILRRVVQSSYADSLVVDDQQELLDDSMKVSLKEGTLAEIGKKILSQPHGWAVGIYRLSQEGARRYFDIANELCRKGPRSISFVVPLQKISGEHPLHAIFTQGRPWVEIDTHEDYEQACRRVEEINSKKHDHFE